VKVNSKDAPFASDSDLKATGAPGSDAIWWGAPSWFIQVTVAPALIVRVAGLKAKFLIAIKFDPPAGDGAVGVVVGGFWAEVQPENEQVMTSMIAHADQKKSREYEIIVSLKAVRNKNVPAGFNTTRSTGSSFVRCTSDTIILRNGG
jgi:hypothetical protein